MLVLQPRISTATDCTGASVGVGVGGTGSRVFVAEGVSVFAGVKGVSRMVDGVFV